MTEINSSVVPWLGQAGVPVSLEFQVHNDSHGAQLSLRISCKYKPAISLALVEE
jgi:hypothetical protein